MGIVAQKVFTFEESTLMSLVETERIKVEKCGFTTFKARLSVIEIQQILGRTYNCIAGYKLKHIKAINSIHLKHKKCLKIE